MKDKSRDIEILKKAGYTRPGQMLALGTVVYDEHDLIDNFGFYFPEYSMDMDKVLDDPTIFDKVIYDGEVFYIHATC